MKRVLFFFAALFCFCAAFSARGEDLSQPGTVSGERRTITLCGTEVPFRWCAAGTFRQGSPTDEPLRDPAEVPHEVELTDGFWLAETETPQTFYEAVTGKNPSSFSGPALPVDTVSWDDAIRFCELLNAKCPTGGEKKFRLPTEAEWEYAARAGNISSGLDGLERRAWSGMENAAGATRPVGTKEPNHWGFFDMQGNLWEWCADGWSDYPTQKTVDPFTPNESNPVRIDRGGCWDSTPQYCRFAWRGVYEHDRAGRYVGFRVLFGYPPGGKRQNLPEKETAGR